MKQEASKWEYIQIIVLIIVAGVVYLALRGFWR